jgi:protease IV
MRNFWGALLGAVLGCIIASVVFAFMVIGGFAAIFSGKGSDKKPFKLEDKTVLHLRLQNSVSDNPADNPFSDFDFATGESRKAASLSQLLFAIEKAAEEDKIKGIFLDLGSVPVGLPALSDIRRSLEKFKESGKFIYAYSDAYAQNAYYLATVADLIALNPLGDFTWKGLGAELMFFKGVLDKIGVEPYAIRPEGNKFKSAVEPFLLTEASPENRQQLLLILDELWATIVETVEARTGIEAQKLNMLADELHITTAKEAMEAGLVDKLLYRDEIMKTLAEAAGWEDAESKDNPLVTMERYTSRQVAVEEVQNKKKKKNIAILYAEGEIVRGKGGSGNIASDNMVKAIREIKKDESIVGLVLRVNSPGGDALASEIIWRELQTLKEKMPVVVSMGDLAASGGYYISCGADSIFASPHTLTGSIGVFGLLFNAKAMLNQKLGVTVDTILTNRSADFPTGSRPMHAREKDALQRNVTSIYEEFTGRVASGRKLELPHVADSLGQGRVWTGRQALERGLVDKLGGLADAVQAVKNMSGEQEAGIKTFPEQKNPIEAFINSLSEEAQASLKDKGLDTFLETWYFFQSASNWEGVRASMPFGVKIIY